MSKIFKRLAEFFVVWGIAGGVALLLFGAMGASSEVFVYQANESPNLSDSLLVIQGDSLYPNSKHYSPDSKLTGQPAKTIRVVVTAYSSCPWETNEDPFTTASGLHVRDGIVAANFLPFGTKIRMPEVYGNRVFEVQDRMHPRKRYHVDIWFPSKQAAINFGVRYTHIEVLDDVQKIVMN